MAAPIPAVSNGFTLTLDDQDIQAALTAMVGRISDMTPVLEDIGRVLQNIDEDAFAAEAGPFGPSWPDLSQVTKDRCASLGKWPGPLLQVTCGLATSISYQADAQRVIVGTGKACDAAYQFGMPKGYAGCTSLGCVGSEADQDQPLGCIPWLLSKLIANNRARITSSDMAGL